MNQNRLEELLQSAIADLMVKHYRMLEIRTRDSGREPVSEVAIAAQLAWILRTNSGLDDRWDVDIEYNRDGSEVKENQNGERRRPDVIIHRRHETGRDNNLLMLELKKDWNGAQQGKGGSPEALRKLRQDLDYQYGVFLSLGMNRSEVVRPRWGWDTDEARLPKDKKDYDFVFADQVLGTLL